MTEPDALDAILAEMREDWSYDEAIGYYYAMSTVEQWADRLAALRAQQGRQPIAQEAVNQMQRRVFNYIHEDYDIDDSYAVDIMEDFLKLLGSFLPRKDSDLPLPLAPSGETP